MALPLNLEQLKSFDDQEKALAELNKLDITKPDSRIKYLNFLASLNLIKIENRASSLKQQPFFQIFAELMFGDLHNLFDPVLRLSQIVTAISNGLIREKLLVSDDIKRIYFFQDSFYYQVEKKGSMIEPIEFLRKTMGSLHLQMKEIFLEIERGINQINPVISSSISSGSFQSSVLSGVQPNSLINSSTGGIRLSISTNLLSSTAPILSSNLSVNSLSFSTSSSKEISMKKLTDIYQYYHSRWNIFRESNLVTLQSQVYKLLVSHVGDLSVIPHLVSGCKIGGIPYRDQFLLIDKAEWVPYDMSNAPVKNNLMATMEFTREEFEQVLNQISPKGFEPNYDYSSCSKYCQLIMTISNYDIVLYQIFLMILANAIAGKVSKTLYTFYSPWNNSGKTTLENIYSKVLGSYCYWATPNIFKNNNSSHQMDRKSACDKRIIIVDDAKNSMKDSPEEIKALTAGASAKISCRGAYDKGVCSYPIAFTLIKSCNELETVSNREFILRFPCFFTSWNFAEGCSAECLQNNSKIHQRDHKVTQPKVTTGSMSYTLPPGSFGSRNHPINKPVFRPKMDQEEFDSILNDRHELLKFVVILTCICYITAEENTLEKLKEQYRKQLTEK